MSMDSQELVAIQQLQHHDLRAAQEKARDWLAAVLDSDVHSVTLTPQPTSLNSFNGTALIDGETIFFKSHTEPGSTIKEYYNSDILHEAGYNVVLPLRSLHSAGEQIAFYPVITQPVIFDAMRRAELKNDSELSHTLIAAEERECERLLGIYRATAENSVAEQHSRAPVHQLFWHRLTAGRFDSFYRGSEVSLPNGVPVAMSEIFSAQWTVNGVRQQRTLGDLVEEAIRVLDPLREAITVVGHGDAHFGNVFLEEDKYFLYFDPAFAGRHSPLLDVVKPLFHNVFAQWMYFPQEIEKKASVVVNRGASGISVEYSDAFSGLRESFLHLKKRALVEPLFEWLAEKDDTYSRRAFELSLMCCPLLTMNLTDRSRFPAAISWLGLALALQMGNWDDEQNFMF